MTELSYQGQICARCAVLSFTRLVVHEQLKAAQMEAYTAAEGNAVTDLLATQ